METDKSESSLIIDNLNKDIGSADGEADGEYVFDNRDIVSEGDSCNHTNEDWPIADEGWQGEIENGGDDCHCVTWEEYMDDQFESLPYLSASQFPIKRVYVCEDEGEHDSNANEEEIRDIIDRSNSGELCPVSTFPSSPNTASFYYHVPRVPSLPSFDPNLRLSPGGLLSIADMKANDHTTNSESARKKRKLTSSVKVSKRNFRASSCPPVCNDGDNDDVVVVDGVICLSMEAILARRMYACTYPARGGKKNRSSSSMPPPPDDAPGSLPDHHVCNKLFTHIVQLIIHQRSHGLSYRTSDSSDVSLISTMYDIMQAEKGRKVDSNHSILQHDVNSSEFKIVNGKDKSCKMDTSDYLKFVKVRLIDDNNSGGSCESNILDDKIVIYHHGTHLWHCPVLSCLYSRSNGRVIKGAFSQLREHVLRHGDKRLMCSRPGCDKRYALVKDLNAHLKKCGTKRFFCLCGSSFQTLNGQRKHIEAHLESSNKGKRKVGEGFAIVHAPSQMESFHSVSGASSSLKIDEQSSSIHIIADENHCVKELKEE